MNTATKKHPDFNEWLKTEDGISSNDISTLTEQKYLTNRLFWAFDAGRNCVWDQYLEQKEALNKIPGALEIQYHAKVLDEKQFREYLNEYLKV